MNRGRALADFAVVGLALLPKLKPQHTEHSTRGSHRDRSRSFGYSAGSVLGITQTLMSPKHMEWGSITHSPASSE